MSDNENVVTEETDLPEEQSKKAVHVKDLVYVRQYIDKKIDADVAEIAEKVQAEVTPMIQEQISEMVESDLSEKIESGVNAVIESELNQIITNEINEKVYTKTEANETFYNKTEIDENIYTKAEVDENIYNKTEIDENIYTKTEIDENIYTKTEIDTLNEEFYKKTDTVDNASKINNIELTQDENGRIRVGDVVIPQKKLLWEGIYDISSEGDSNGRPNNVISLTNSMTSTNAGLELHFESGNSDGSQIAGTVKMFIKASENETSAVGGVVLPYSSNLINSWGKLVTICIYLMKDDLKYINIGFPLVVGTDTITKHTGKVRVTKIYEIIE